MSKKFILNLKGKPVEEPDFAKWAKWYENNTKKRIVKQTTVANKTVISTVFLGLDHRWNGDGLPILWETLVFTGKHDGYMNRYTSLEQAKAGHKRIVRMIEKEYSKEEDDGLFEEREI